LSIVSEENKSSIERYLLEKLASGKAAGKLLVSLVRSTLAILLDLKARCLIEICSEAIAESVFDQPLSLYCPVIINVLLRLYPMLKNTGYATISDNNKNSHKIPKPPSS
jgi:hypothetical protein